MTNAHDKVEDRETPEMGSNRAFGIVFAAFFAILGFFPLVFGDGIWRVWPFAVAGSFLCVALAVPRALTPLNKIWFKFGLLLHRLMTPIILFILYFVSVTPIAAILRIFGKDPLNRKFDPSAGTYWIERDPPGPASDSFRNQF
ncbi:MAG: SxtJ family membrane protein [Rhodospirillales bacterium]